MKRSLPSKIITLVSRNISNNKAAQCNMKRNYLHRNIFANNYVEYSVPIKRDSDRFAYQFNEKLKI